MWRRWCYLCVLCRNIGLCEEYNRWATAHCHTQYGWWRAAHSSLTNNGFLPPCGAWWCLLSSHRLCYWSVSHSIFSIGAYYLRMCYSHVNYDWHFKIWLKKSHWICKVQYLAQIKIFYFRCLQLNYKLHSLALAVNCSVELNITSSI